MDEDGSMYAELVKRKAEEEIETEDFKTRVIQEKAKIRAHKPRGLLRWLFSWI